jgi:beta-lactamase regulating signal transducer with metallopeptidase domain
MDNLFVLAAHNTVLALVLALLVLVLARLWRNPPVAHLLWLLVLLRLVAPPIMRVDWSAASLPGSTAARGQLGAPAPRTDGLEADNPARYVDLTAARPAAQEPALSEAVPHRAAGLRLTWNRARPALLSFWLGGAIVCALITAMRIARFERFLRGTLPASERLQQLAIDVASQLGVRRVPDLRLAECIEVPLVWCAAGRPTIVLPIKLVRQIDDLGLLLILAHELAHLRRRDHWVRAVELFATTVYWWNPLLWAIRRQIHQTEELCCDAWVRWTFRDCAQRYAEVVLETAESLSARPVGACLLPASPFLRSLSLQARIEMILDSRFSPRVSRKSMLVIALLALLVLPTFAATSKTEAPAGSSGEPPAAQARKQEAQATSEFPYAVRFEQGATRFLKGDRITILEVRGTANTFSPGNLYWIKGTYTLASHDRGTLAAYITAMDAANGRSASLKVQTADVNQGEGTFKLYLPMPCRGWPHVSFYPVDGGSDFGGNYFGTGDSVLKRWWGSKETD